MTCRPRPATGLLLGAVVLWTFATGCATYSERTAAARAHARAGDYQGALDELNDFLGVPGGELPDTLDSDTALGVLERASVLQALQEYETSTADYQAADKALEVLDLGSDAGGTLAEYLFSGDKKRYRTSPTEKLSLNAMNMLNYLALGDLSGARVEAQRFTVMRNYLRDYDPDHAYGAIGSYLAGFVFEQLGDLDRAMRYYDEALQSGSLATLREPVSRLAPLTSYRGRHLRDLISDPGPAPQDAGEILVVVSLGTAPLRVPETIGIGTAIGLYSVYITGNTDILERSVLKVVSYPALVESPNRVLARARLSVDGRSVPVERVSDLAVDIRKEYEAAKGRIIGAAITRMITRAAAAEAARATAEELAEDSSSGLGALVGVLASLAVEGSLVAADRPDTRSWTLLPGEVHAARYRVAPGEHEVELVLTGSGEQEIRTVTVEVPPRGYAVVVVTTLR